MKRVLYSIPLFFLLLPWLFFSLVVLAVGLNNPFALILLLPTGVLLGAAFFFHRSRSKADQHGLAAVGAGAILVSPLVALLIAFFSFGQDIAHKTAQDTGYMRADTAAIDYGVDCSVFGGCKEKANLTPREAVGHDF